jgi:hypothetical protein
LFRTTLDELGADQARDPRTRVRVNPQLRRELAA